MTDQMRINAGGAGSFAITDAERARWRFTIGYYLVLAVWHVIVHQSFFADLVGDAPANWFILANEVYVVAFFVPLFWDFVATRRLHTGVELVTHETSGPSPLVRHLLWYGFLAAVMVSLEGPLWENLFGEKLPQHVVTLRDVGFGFIMLSIYFDWSRGLWRPIIGKAPRLVSGWWRLTFILVVLAANIAIFQEPVKDLLGAHTFTTLDFHAEGFAVMFFVPFYFDIILPRTGGDALRGLPGPLRSARRWVILAVWMAAMLFFLWIGQGAVRSWFDPLMGVRGSVFDPSNPVPIVHQGFGQWFKRSSEPPLAAFIFTLYFELIRRFDGVPDDALIPGRR